MSDDVFVDTPTIENIIGQLPTLIATDKWRLARPRANMMRGVDFYNATDFISALLLSVQLFKNAHGFVPRLGSPASFNEHIFARKFFAPLPIPSLGDKLGVRDYVRRRLGEDVLNPVVWSGDSIDGLFAASLPAGRFVLKANHGAGMNLVLDLPQDLGARRDEIRARGREWLGIRFGYNWGEWHYSVFKPRLFLEAFLGQGDNQPMDEFKVHCFHGKARLIQVVTGRFTKLRLGQYAPDWTFLTVGMPGYDTLDVARPKNLEVLVDSAERLARGLDYARIDLYSDREQVMKFGEITLTPGNGHQRYTDFDFERWLGGFFAPPAGP